MKTLLSLFLFLCWSLPFAYGQSPQSSGATQVPSTVSTTIEQIGDVSNPLFVVDAVLRGESLLESNPFLSPFNGTLGRGNAAQITQLGERNLTVLSQYGEQNVASIQLEGDANVVNATQTGVGNRLGVSVLGSGNTIPISQIGVGNELSLELLNVNGLALDNLPNGGIRQIGGGVPLLIQISPGN